jgi:DNA-binding transcriptional ArsR family regulator
MNRMSAICRICSHPNRKEIDEALLANAPRQKVADQYGVSVRSVGRHLANHLNGALSPKAPKPWERRPGERARQWNAFEAYLRLCTESQDRDISYAELARSLGLSPETVRSWAWRYKWKERVDAWLLEIARSRLKRLRAEAERSRERWRNVGRAMQEIGARRLAKIDPDELEPQEARRFLMDGSTLEHRGFEAVLEHAADGHQRQLNVQINIDSDHARRVIELHESRRQLESEALTLAQENEQGDS